MAYNQDRVQYDLAEEYENVTEYEDSDSEHESEISDDEFDDQGHDNYENVPDYVNIEEEPLRVRASRNVAASRGSSQQPAPSSEQQAGSSSDPQPGSSADPQPGSSADDPDQLNIAFLGQDSQFEDASSPEKQATNARFALRSLRNPSTKRSYRESDDHSSDENAGTPRRTPAGRGSRRMLASLDLDQPISS